MLTCKKGEYKKKFFLLLAVFYIFELSMSDGNEFSAKELGCLNGSSLTNFSKEIDLQLTDPILDQ